MKQREIKIEAICPNCGIPIFFEVGIKDNKLIEVSISEELAKKLGITMEKTKGICQKKTKEK